MGIVKSEFALALNQVATERGISPQDVLASIEAAVLAAFKKEHADIWDEDVAVVVSKDNGETKVIRAGKDITPPGFGRIAAQTARQVILQKIREAEKKNIISQFRDQVGSIIRGRIIRTDAYNVHVDIGKSEAVLPREEQIRNETYRVNSQIVALLKDIVEDKFGHSRIVLSRSDVNLLKELFKREVPEIGTGTVEIKDVVREPGERAKIAVHSSQGGVDPVGACVGQKGVRVQTVTDELGGAEKIDIIPWSKDTKTYLTSALSPAKILGIEIDTVAKLAKVTVDESQAPLAIGKGGVNVNLASRLVGYEIDIIQVPVEGSKEEVAQVQETPEPESGSDAAAVEDAPAAAEPEQAA
ncbi:MAG: transcription termination factor NusA [Patescibacteria group bacterium]|nr:transcription termination factor NusA [Patescibacteria group bacterium]